MKTMKTLLLTLIAITIYTITFAQNPGSAKIFLDEGNLTKAKEAIDKAMANEKHVAKAKTWHIKGLIYAAISNDQTGIFKKELDKEGNADEIALEAFDKAISLDAENPKNIKIYQQDKKDKLFPALLNSAINMYNAGRKVDNDESAEAKKLYESAMKKCKVAQELNPEDTLVHVIAVTCAYPLKDMKTVKEAAEKLVANPNFKGKDFYYQVLAFHYRDVEKDNNKAIEFTKKGLELTPNDKNLQGLLLDLYIKENKMEEAIVETKKTVDQNPNDAQAQFRLGILYEKINKPEEALKSYEKSVSLDPTAFDPLYNLGALYFNKGAEILKFVNAMALDEYNKKGKAEEEKANKEFEKALPYFEKLYKMDSKNTQVLNPLAQIYSRLKMMDKAEKIKKELEAIDKD